MKDVKTRRIHKEYRNNLNTLSKESSMQWVSRYMLVEIWAWLGCVCSEHYDVMTSWGWNPAIKTLLLNRFPPLSNAYYNGNSCLSTSHFYNTTILNVVLLRILWCMNYKISFETIYFLFLCMTRRGVEQLKGLQESGWRSITTSTNV